MRPGSYGPIIDGAWKQPGPLYMLKWRLWPPEITVPPVKLRIYSRSNMDVLDVTFILAKPWLSKWNLFRIQHYGSVLFALCCWPLMLLISIFLSIFKDKISVHVYGDNSSRSEFPYLETNVIYVCGISETATDQSHNPRIISALFYLKCM